MTQETNPTPKGHAFLTCRLLNKKGIHARTAAQLVLCTQGFKAHVTVCFQDTCVNGHSILGLMMLGAKKGDSLTFQAKGEKALEALEALKILVENKFGEE